MGARRAPLLKVLLLVMGLIVVKISLYSGLQGLDKKFLHSKLYTSLINNPVIFENGSEQKLWRVRLIKA